MQKYYLKGKLHCLIDNMKCQCDVQKVTEVYITKVKYLITS